jgi:two-component system, OmpR family, sensor histidine kinase TctE
LIAAGGLDRRQNQTFPRDAPKNSATADVRLAILYVVATAAIVGVLIYRAYDTAGSLNERELSLRAADLARHIAVGSDGRAVLQLPASLAAAYDSTHDTDIFAIRGDNGLVIAALPQSFGVLTKPWPAAKVVPFLHSFFL